VGGIPESGSLNGGAGGSGIVIVRYAGSPAGTGGSVTPGTGTAIGYTLHTFTTTGSTTVTTALDLSGLNLNERLGLTLTEGITGAGNLTFDGPGRLTLAGTNTYSGTTTISSGTLALGSAASLASPVIDVASGGRLDVSALTGGLALGNGQRLGGRGTLLGDVTFGSGSQLAFDPLGPLAISSGTLTFAADFGVTNLIGIDWDSVALNTPLSLISTSQTTFGALANFGFENRTSVGSIGRQAYFESGSLQVIVVPEPSASPLVAAGLIGLVVYGWRQRTGLQGGQHAGSGRIPGKSAVFL